MDRGLEVGRAAQEQVHLLVDNADILHAAWQESEKKLVSIEADVKEQRGAVDEAKRKGEQTEQRVIECRARTEQIEESLQQLEGKVKEVLENGKAVISQVQQLQQGLYAALHQVVYHELRRFHDERRAQVAPSLAVSTPINCLPGSTVGVVGTADLQASTPGWESVSGLPLGGAHLGQTQEQYQGNTVVNQFNSVVNSADILGGVQVGQLGEEVVTLPVTLGGTGAGGEPRPSPGGLLGAAVQQIGLSLGAGGVEVQPGPSGSQFPVEFVAPGLKDQERPARDQGRRTDQAKDTRKRSSSPSRDRAKRARETPLEERERLRGVSGHSGKPLREVQPWRREDLPKRPGGSRRGEEGREDGDRIRGTENWIRSQRRPKALSQESVVVTYENTGRSRREAFSSHDRLGIRSRSRSRSRGRRRAGESFQKKESRRK